MIKVTLIVTALFYLPGSNSEIVPDTRKEFVVSPEGLYDYQQKDTFRNVADCDTYYYHTFGERAQKEIDRAESSGARLRFEHRCEVSYE